MPRSRANCWSADASPCASICVDCRITAAAWSPIASPAIERHATATATANYDPKQRNPENKDNLFLASIVAVDADTGKYIWHYQVNPNEAWDFKATADMILTDLIIGG